MMYLYSVRLHNTIIECIYTFTTSETKKHIQSFGGLLFFGEILHSNLCFLYLLILMMEMVPWWCCCWWWLHFDIDDGDNNDIDDDNLIVMMTSLNVLWLLINGSWFMRFDSWCHTKKISMSLSAVSYTLTIWLQLPLTVVRWQPAFNTTDKAHIQKQRIYRGFLF